MLTEANARGLVAAFEQCVVARVRASQQLAVTPLRDATLALDWCRAELLAALTTHAGAPRAE